MIAKVKQFSYANVIHRKNRTGHAANYHIVYEYANTRTWRGVHVIIPNHVYIIIL